MVVSERPWLALARRRGGGVGAIVLRALGSDTRRALVLGVLLGAGVAALVVGALAFTRPSPSSLSQTTALARNPTLDPGTPINGVAPDFTLTDQFGRSVSLSAFRGKVVILAFNDPQCTTICPLTTTAMVKAKRLLGPAGAQVELLGVGANPAATETRWVRAYSEAHGMMHAWHFLNGPLAQLKRVWHAYGIEAQIVAGQVDHTPAVYVIDGQGELSRLFMTQMSYSSVGQLASLFAQAAASLLRGHPQVRSVVSYTQIPLIEPTSNVTLPRVGGGSVQLGPGAKPRLILFFDTWDSEVTGLARELEALDAYAKSAGREGLPALTAVDEASVEPSSAALPRLLRSLPHPLSYPIAIDSSGRLADGYRVQDEPYLELISPSGGFLWYHDVSTGGWLTRAALVSQIHAALAPTPSSTETGADARQQLASSPPALAELHRQAGQLIGSESALAARLRSLRGYPVVLNVWASWCGPCRSEFPLLANASVTYGRRVAFLGADTEDQAANARSFLADHHVAYPSYEASTEALSSLAAFEGVPTTMFFDREGKLVHVHFGQYEAQGTLDHDIESYALRD
jgi:cytochrome oxidase Cu insertion factor (SCO1/SenC/PrrC family)/thiol-disulfide isomerase/thioredoxin